MNPCGSRRSRRPSCSAGPRSTRSRSSASQCATTPRRSRGPPPSRSGSKGPESARQPRSRWNCRSRAESGPSRSASRSRRPISRAARGRSRRSRRRSAGGPSRRPRSASPSPAGPCGWSATSTTTRCGGAPRASSPQSRLLLPDEHGELPEVRTAFELVALHLDAARRDPDYKFVLAEIDYLKPHFDAHPEDRADLLRLHRGGPDRARRRQLQRAEHQPDQRRVHHPQRRLRHRLPARRARRRPAHRLDAGRVRLRPRLPRA